MLSAIGCDLQLFLQKWITILVWRACGWYIIKVERGCPFITVAVVEGGDNFCSDWVGGDMSKPNG